MDFSKVLKDFYENNKDNKLLLSQDGIRKITMKTFSFNEYGLHNIFKNNIDDIIFGFKKTGLCFTIDSVIVSVNIPSTKSTEVIKHTFDEINYKIDIETEHPVLELSLGIHKKSILFNLSGHKKLIDLINNELFPNIKIEKEEQRLKELQVSQNNVLSELDKDGNGEVDIVEGDDFNLLLKKHQKSIVEIDRNYVQQFVKVSSYLKTKKGNIQSLFNNIKGTPNQEVLNKYVEILKDEIHTYNLVLFNSLNMIVSLVEDDMITFYEIHEMFDTLNMFDSQHEKNVSQRLTNIGDGLESLMYEIRDMGNQLSNSFADLSYVTEESNRQLTEQLSGIDSSIQTNNLLTGIQTYQMYKVNKNTKSLKE
jgi:hypothetical protein